MAYSGRAIFKPRETTGEKAKRQIKKFLPIVEWLPKYTFSYLARDIIAGLTVGLMVIPQGLAYATIAGLSPQYGLYSAFMGCFVYCFFGTSKDVTLGPTAIMSLMVNHFGEADPARAIALSLFCGIIQFTMGVLRLGFIVRFISVPVISGFVSAAAVTIGFGQVKNLLGLSGIPRDSIHCIAETFRRVSETNLYDLALGSCCIVLLLLLKHLNKTQWPDEGEGVAMPQRIARKVVWVVTTGRNALIVLVASLIALAVDSQGYKEVFTLTGTINSGVPPFEVKHFLLLCFCFFVCLIYFNEVLVSDPYNHTHLTLK